MKQGGGFIRMYEARVLPFLTWPEEKAGKIGELRSRFPMELGVLVNRYVDPFVGGGSVLFEVMSTPGMQEGVISDINPELVNTYKQVQLHVDDLLSHLQSLENQFLERSWQEKIEFYKTCRLRYLYLKDSSREDILVRKAAIFILLNTTGCLCEKSSDGFFITENRNRLIVPKQALRIPRICDERKLRLASRLLQNVKILCCDFKECLLHIDKHTFLYLDPPCTDTRADTALEVGHGIRYAFTRRDTEAVISVSKIARGLGAEVLTDPHIRFVLEKKIADKQNKAGNQKQEHSPVYKSSLENLSCRN